MSKYSKIQHLISFETKLLSKYTKIQHLLSFVRKLLSKYSKIQHLLSFVRKLLSKYTKTYSQKYLAHTWSGILFFTDFHAKMRVKMVKFVNEFREFPKISRILQKLKFSEIAITHLPTPPLTLFKIYAVT